MNKPRKNLKVCNSLILALDALANSNLLISKAAEFESLFCPFINRIYRSALIVAKSSLIAKQLVKEICRKAWQHFHRQKPAKSFSRWLAKLVDQSFTKYETTGMIE